MSKHSPGPWRWGHDPLENRVPDGLFDPNGGWVIQCAWRPRAADARLIAAAPRLLEALRLLADDMAGGFGPGGDYGRHMPDSIKAAWALIREIEGPEAP